MRQRTILLLGVLLIGLAQSAPAGETLANATIDRKEFSAGAACLITVQLKKPSDIRISIQDAHGTVVRILDACQQQLLATYAWNGRDARNEPAPVGEYALTIEVGRRAKLDTAFGVQGVLQQDFISPYDVQVDRHGNLWMADAGERALYAFTADGKPLESFGQHGKLLFAEQAHPPMAVRIDDDGNVYTTGPFHNLSKYDRTGKLLMTIGEYAVNAKGEMMTGGSAFPVGIGLAGEKLYFFQGGGVGSPRVYYPTFEKRNGFLYGPGEALGYLSPTTPGTVASHYGYVGPGGKAAPDGTLYACTLGSELWKMVDTGDDIVKRYIATLGPDGTPLRNATGLDIGPDGAIWVADWGNDRIVRFTDTGEALTASWSFGRRGEANPADGMLLNPHSAAVSPDGKYLYVAEDGEPRYDYEKKAVIPESAGAHRLTKWDISTTTDSTQLKVIYNGAR